MGRHETEYPLIAQSAVFSEGDLLSLKDPIRDAKSSFRSVERRYPGKVEFSEVIGMVIELGKQPVPVHAGPLSDKMANDLGRSRSGIQQQGEHVSEAPTPAPAVIRG